MNPLPGEIWLADLGLAAKTRPVVIVSRQDPNPPRSLVLYVPLTTQQRNSPYEAPLPRLTFLARESVANVQGLGSLPTVRLERKIGRLSVDVMARLKDALAFALDSKAFRMSRA
jgi:mRNA interferase MazF